MLWWFAFLKLFACRSCFRFEFQILDDVFRCLCDNVTDIVETFAACAASYLVEVTGCQNGRLVATVLAELRKEHSADRNVHAHAERVRTANDFEQTLLCEFFAENTILRQEPCVMNADALLEPTLDIRTIRA